MEKGNIESNELKLENERLQNSIMILTQKLTIQDDDNKEIVEKQRSELNKIQDKYNSALNDNKE